MSMRTDPRRRAGANGSNDPWRDAPTSELGDQVLPRWFVLTALAAVVLAIVVLVAAFVVPRRSTVPEQARRPPPSESYTTAVGRVQTGTSAPEAYDAPCEMVRGVRIAGSETDRATLRRGLAGLCNTALPADIADDVRAFAAQQGTLRFAAFEATGVDSTATRAGPPTIFLNSRFQTTDPLWIAPLVVHDATLVRAGDVTAATALEARRAELQTCERLLGGDTRSRACGDAAAVVGLEDPIAALRAAGFE